MRRPSSAYRLGLVATLGLGSIAPRAAIAQKSPPVMRGAVQDTLGRPLEGAQVEIVGLDRIITTPASGAFRFNDIRPGKYWVAVRRIGYVPLRTTFTFSPGDDREFEFQLEPVAHQLPEIKVRGEDRAWKQRYQDFVWRSRTGLGYFLTRDDIRKTRAYVLGNVIQRFLPGTTSDAFYQPGFVDPFGGRPFGATRASIFANADFCSPAVSVNGGRPLGGSAVNDFQPDEVEAVEVYRNVGMMPTEFAMWGTSCGLVVIWTGA